MMEAIRSIALFVLFPSVSLVVGVGGVADAIAQPVSDAEAGNEAGTGAVDQPADTAGDVTVSGDDAGATASPAAAAPAARPPDEDETGVETGAEVPGAGADGGAADAEAADAEAADAAGGGEPAAAVADKAGPTLKVGGALRLNYFVKTWEGEEQNRERFGDFAFDTFRFNVDGGYGPLALSAEYRIYQGYHMLHHGYVGYALSDDAVIDVGVSQAPFGLLEYASHNWFFDITYYLGFEDDYDMGVRGKFKLGDVDVRLALYKNSETAYTGSSIASARYSYDVVPTSMEELGYAGLTEGRSNSETNQFNARAAYTLAHGEGMSTEIGVSGRVGGLYNAETTKTGYHWAGAVHANGTYGPVNVQLQGLAYQFRPENPDGVDDSFVVMGAYDFPYLVAARGYILTANLAYTLPMTRGPLDSLMFYNDYSVLLKSESDFPATHQNVTGVLIAAGPIYTYVDFIVGRHHAWVGPNYGSALAGGNVDESGDPDGTLHGRFNVNIGYYF